MTLHGLNNQPYQTGIELGKGGEGQVFVVENHASLVLKKYNHTPSSEKLNKLSQMVLLYNPEIDGYAAWPREIIYDSIGAVCGFTMKKLNGYVPIHTVFNPMDRKKIFPEKGYNFLVHVARNLATAFYKLHEAELIVGDVNEGNILINSAGFVSFIDCDSFQVKDRENNGYFYCEVGIPRYTPPEIMKEGTYENIVRTVNTDSFSLAVLIFQLLFLGRHPFAGKNNTIKDIDEETAIKNNEFAYSLIKKRKKLLPPVDSFNITNLSEPLVEMFHRAFEQNDRPKPIEWIRALEDFLLDFTTCSLTKLHTFPAKLVECPWCAFRKTKGILYFLDDSYLQANLALNDIDNFINGFKIEKLVLKKLLPDSFTFANLIPDKIDDKYYKYRSLLVVSVCSSILFGLLLCMLHPFFILISIFFPVLIYYFSGWAKKLKNKHLHLKTENKTQKQKLALLINEYNQPIDLVQYNKSFNLLNIAINDFKNIPIELDNRKKQMEECLYNEQLTDFLWCFKIENNTIPQLGATRKSALISNGILNAADINNLQSQKVAGIGPKNYQILLSWQRQIASGFIYIPDNKNIANELAQIDSAITVLKSNLETAIRKNYQAINYLKPLILNSQIALETKIIELARKIQKEEIELANFLKLVRFL